MQESETGQFSKLFHKIKQEFTSLALNLVVLVCLAAWLTHAYIAFTKGYVLLDFLSSFFFPIGIVHGFGYWFGFWT